MYAGSDVVSRHAGDVPPCHVRDGQPARVAAVAAVDAGRDVDGLVDALNVDVFKGDVTNVALARVRLDPSRVGGMLASDILKDNVVDEVHCVVADAPDAGAARLTADYVAHVDVGAVTFY